MHFKALGFSYRKVVLLYSIGFTAIHIKIFYCDVIVTADRYLEWKLEISSLPHT